MEKAKFVAQTTGNWCDGYWWEIVSCKTGRVYHSGGPYHSCDLCDPRGVALEDAVEFAHRHDLELIRIG